MLFRFKRKKITKIKPINRSSLLKYILKDIYQDNRWVWNNIFIQQYAGTARVVDFY